MSEIAYENIGKDCFTNGEVISYKGKNYYRPCDSFVQDMPEGSASYCIKIFSRADHDHEDYWGNINKKGSPTWSSS